MSANIEISSEEQRPTILANDSAPRVTLQDQRPRASAPGSALINLLSRRMTFSVLQLVFVWIFTVGAMLAVFLSGIDIGQTVTMERIAQSNITSSDQQPLSVADRVLGALVSHVENDAPLPKIAIPDTNPAKTPSTSAQ